MHVRICLGLALLVPTLTCAVATAAPIPREAPALTVTDVMGQKRDLSQFKGGVTLIEFMLLRCSSCTQMAKKINKLYGELAGRGFRPVAVVFDDGVSDPVIRDYANLLKLEYPLGYASSEDVDRYLARAAPQRFQVPQLVVIDRAGVIRAQSHPSGEMLLTDEGYLRNFLGTLLDERAPQAAK